MTKLDDIEIAGFATLLGGAGAETVTKLVGNAAVVFARYPDAVAEAARRPQQDSGRGRGTAALRGAGRSTTFAARMKEVQVHGGTIPAGKPVFLIGAAANRDPRAFDRRRHVRHRPRPHRGAEPRARLRDPQLPRRRAGPHGDRDRAGESARLHAALRGGLGRAATRPHAERRRLAQRPGEGAAMTESRSRFRPVRKQRGVHGHHPRGLSPRRRGHLTRPAARGHAGERIADPRCGAPVPPAGHLHQGVGGRFLSRADAKAPILE